MTEKSAPMNVTNRVVANIRRLRKMRGWSARELAERMTAAGCPISRQVIGNRESNQVPSRISVDELFAFADVLGRSVIELSAEEIACARCHGEPPVGFTCNECGENAACPE